MIRAATNDGTTDLRSNSLDGSAPIKRKIRTLTRQVGNLSHRIDTLVKKGEQDWIHGKTPAMYGDVADMNLLDSERKQMKEEISVLQSVLLQVYGK